MTNLEAGANDYMVNPLSFSELLARVRVQLRRPEQTSSVLLEAGGLTLDVSTREVRIDGKTRGCRRASSRSCQDVNY